LPSLARTVVLNLGHCHAKNLFVDPSGREHEQIKTFCVIKCLVTWNAEVSSRICRERLGGGSYLSSAVINEGVVGAHSGMTAEGDNRVLM